MGTWELYMGKWELYMGALHGYMGAVHGSCTWVPFGIGGLIVYSPFNSFRFII